MMGYGMGRCGLNSLTGDDVDVGVGHVRPQIELASGIRLLGQLLSQHSRLLTENDRVLTQHVGAERRVHQTPRFAPFLRCEPISLPRT